MIPDVSIIIPNFNKADYLKETLDSVTSQTYNNWECIIIDDGSTDNSKTIINQYILKDSRFRFYSRLNTEKPKGVSSCRNIGIERATGEYIVFLDSDDLLLDNCLSDRLEYAFSAKKADLYIFKMQALINGELGRIIGIPPESYLPESYIKMIFKGVQPFTVTSILWRREALIGLNGFDEKLHRLEDPDLHLRAFYKNSSYRFFEDSEPDCLYRMDDDYQKRFKNKGFLEIVCSSFLYFTKKHINLLNVNKAISKEKSRSWIKNWSLYFLRDYFLKLNSILMHIKFILLAFKSRAYSVNEFIKVKLVVLYNLIGLNNIKGFGYHTLQKGLFDKIR